ncbi:hypothetical protein B0H67DRAFT_647089 [Lasiosphaeris hirsuta]|uniref:Uncharacterized protein n=1 Tax=Lasiosphaeris hirsuta TaxID=260670 RepID=A0AA40DSJ1_9PEZI|nr:hypothetical protein B0H67DRAFT_647089 [Lasiosphaeris hirsuta]
MTRRSFAPTSSGFYVLEDKALAEVVECLAATRSFRARGLLDAGAAVYGLAGRGQYVDAVRAAVIESHRTN